jgi:quinol monooxygenase YgiN
MTHTVLVLIEAKPGKENEVKKILHALVKPSRQEEGCINYDLHDCPDNSGKFMFYENWTSKAAHDTHSASTHVTAAKLAATDLLLKPLDVSYWDINK